MRFPKATLKQLKEAARTAADAAACIPYADTYGRMLVEDLDPNWQFANWREARDILEKEIKEYEKS